MGDDIEARIRACQDCGSEKIEVVLTGDETVGDDGSSDAYVVTCYDCDAHYFVGRERTV